ncbi:GNAT family N-acetyltransferase [Thalassotalea euphylliae]|uniref:N-acetyltransferase n=1 Tax=Thalassotalea euphylliae TaxID=1655234 RepID=A0A3E0UFC2_9GAMM|nr:GNAT family N-acetyltransferase [Thalassotalea euphylliae]REL34542.1 N-acetyltransferase [Thalassotalea euphylliae]
MTTIRNLSQANALDAKAICDIYNHYIETSTATFEETPISAEEISHRIDIVLAAKLPWLVIENEQQQLVGYAYASKWRERSAYRFAVEVSVYLSPQHLRQGLGLKLYRVLFDQLKALGIRHAIGGITLPNPASVGLHEKLGMAQAAQFNKVGLKFRQWLDVGYWQLDFHAEPLQE